MCSQVAFPVQLNELRAIIFRDMLVKSSQNVVCHLYLDSYRV